MLRTRSIACALRARSLACALRARSLASVLRTRFNDLGRPTNKGQVLQLGPRTVAQWVHGPQAGLARGQGHAKRAGIARLRGASGADARVVCGAPPPEELARGDFDEEPS